MKRTIVVLVAAIVLCTNIAAQNPPAPAPQPQPDCKITKVLSGGVVKVGKMPIPFSLQTKNCTDITEVSADGLEFTEFEFKGGKVFARVKQSSANAGTVSLKIKDSSGTETESPDDVWILVLDAADAYNARIAQSAASSAAKAGKDVKVLAAKLNSGLAARPTTDAVKTMLEEVVKPFQARIAELEQQVKTQQAALQAAQVATTDEIRFLKRGVEYLAEGQRDLANTRKGLLRRPINKKVAASAEEIRQVFASRTDSEAVAGNN